MKRVFILLGIVAILASAVSAKVYTEEFNWSGGENAEKFLLSVSSSDVTVKAGGDSIVIKAVKKAKKKDDLDKIDVVVKEEGNIVKAYVEYKKDKKDLKSFFTFNTTDVDFEITMPTGVAFGLDSSSGDTEITGIDIVGIDASSGDIRVRDCEVAVIDSSSGNVTVIDGVKAKVDLSSGDIMTSGVSSVEVEASSGDIDVTGGYKRVEAEVSSGDITITNNAKPSEYISADTTSGDITVDFITPEEGGVFSFECTSGDVILNLIGDVNNLDLTTDGFLDDVDIDIPALSSVKIAKGVYSAKSGDGSNKVDITSTSGSIEVTAK